MFLSLFGFLAVCYSSLYVFYSVGVGFVPQPPPLVFSGYSFLVCGGSYRVGRASLTFSDFEELPAGWGLLGGSWVISVGAGFRGNSLQGTDNNGGPGGSSIYYWGSSISSYTSFSVSVKVRQVTQAGGGVYMGVILLQSNSVSSRSYEISVYASGTTGYLEIWYWSGNRWSRLYRSTQSFYVDGTRWFILLINYSRVASTNTISATVYDVNGNVLASGSVQIGGARFFTPSYVGVSVDGSGGVAGAQAMFDDFVISIGSPRYLLVEGIPQGYSVELYDDEGFLVAGAVSDGGVVSLDVLRDVVVGRGLGASFKIYGGGIEPCTTLIHEAVVGGDYYRVLIHSVLVNLSDYLTRAEVTVIFSPYSLTLPETQVLKVLNQDSMPYYVGLVFYPNSSLVSEDLKLIIKLSNGTSSTTLLIDGSSPPSQPVHTDLLLVVTEAVINVSVSKDSNTQSSLSLELTYCSDPISRSICVYYPITLRV